MKKYLILLILLLNCGESVNEFYYGKDPTETFYVKESKNNFSVEENVLGQYSVLGSESGSENFVATKKEDVSLGHYTQSEEVIQVENISKVDMIWSIDNSISMGPYQTRLANSFNLFIEDFAEKNIDFKMAIVTTGDANNRDTNNKLNSTELKKNKDNFINDFKNKVKVGANSMQIHATGERGFEFVKQFLQNNVSWPRSDALLVIIYLSDEPEQSLGTVQSHADYMTSIKSNDLKKIKVFSICNNVTRDWTSPYGFPFNGSGCHRFSEISSLTGGLTRYINGSFADIAKEFGESITSSVTMLKTVFALNITPSDLTKLKVEIDGSEVSRDKTEVDGWNYDSVDNTIEFFGSHVPSKGSNIKIYQEGEVKNIFQLTDEIESDRVNFLVVEVNGKIIPRDTSETNGWNYDSSANRVEFFGSYRPAKGARINITLPGKVDNFIPLSNMLNTNHLSKVEIVVGGNIIPRDDTKTNGWAYNGQNNTIEFFGRYSLSEGDTVKISLGVTSSFCALKGFDLKYLSGLKVVVGDKAIPWNPAGTSGWTYNEKSNCIELYGENGLEPGTSVEISWGKTSKFCLGKPLDQSKLETAIVKIDGTVIEKSGEGVGWNYDGERNCISFFGIHMPRVNSKIEIIYTPDYRGEQ